MNLNSDFSTRVVIETSTLPLVDSPVSGVRRQLLDRIGGEVARATSIVHYAPGSSFPRHTHDGGEEIFVLDGIFSDASGDFGPGTYIKNPAGSTHTPGSLTGCTLFVKLRHLDSSDTHRLVVDTRNTPWIPGLVTGLSVIPLSEFGTQHTALVQWAPGTRFKHHRHYGGEEIYVVQGVFADEHGRYPAGTWIRNPHLSTHCPFSEEGCIILVKVGHLPCEQIKEAFA